MAEFNPYKLEEEKWTPNNVYEILPPNAVSWSDYEFGQGTDNVDQEAANKSLIDGFVDFFRELFGTAGKILAGAVELGGAVLGGFVKGVVGLIGGIAKAIGSIFRSSGESPNLPLFNPIKTNLEEAIQPQRDKINESLQRTEEILAEQLVLRGQMEESLQDMRDARDRANEAIEKSGQSIAEAQAASDAAEAARQKLEAYNTALNKRITTEFNSAVGRADTAVKKADTLAGELADFKAQHQREINNAVGKAEQAVDDLATITPKVADAVAKSKKATEDVSTLTPKVSDAADKAGEAFDLFVKNQDKWNKGVTAALETQKKVNDNFKKWSDGAANAIEANTNAIKALNAPTNASSALPLIPGTSTPTWTEGLTKSIIGTDRTGYDAPLPLGITEIYSSGWVKDKSEKIFTNPHRNLVTVDSRIEYEASWWMRATRGGRFAYVTLCDETGNRHIIEKLPATELDSNPSQHTWGNPIRALITSPNGSGWTKFTTRFKFKEGVSKVRVDDVNFVNTDNSSGTTYYIADLQINPAIPSQADVDKAQNDAIKANTEALKALGKKVLGASLVPYKTPSTQEVLDYAAGRLNYDPWADPEYLNAGHSIVSTSRGRVARANADHRMKEFSGSYVSVDSSIEYKVQFHTYANTSSSKIYIPMYDQDGNYAISSTPFADSGKGSGNLVHALTLPSGVKYWSGVIKFKSGVTEVRLGNFYWNASVESAAGVQEFGGLEIVPNIPDANVVNELQDNAIRKNTQVGTENKKAIEALRDGLNAAIELGEVNQIVGGLRDELEEEAKKREALQEKIDALQNEMIPRTIVSDDRVTYDDYVELSGDVYPAKVTAKGSWAGQLAVTYVDNTVKKTLVTRKSVPDGTTRSWFFLGDVERVDYWVYQGSQRSILLMNAGPYITGSSFSNGTWGVLATHKVGKTYGTGKIEWRANLLHADRNVTYRFAIEVNGTTVKNVYWNGVGPLTPLGDGKRTLKFEHEFNLPDNATVRILGYASGSGSQQAKVSLLQGTLAYVQDTAREG